MRLSHLAKLSGALILTAGLAGTASANNYGSDLSPHEACKSDENRGKLIGGGLGAVAGAVIGSQVAGNGARTEASVIGGVIGGLAGAGIADKRVDCDPVYSDGRPVTSGTTHSSTVYESSPTYTTPSTTYGTTRSAGYHQTASYPQTDYGTRTTVSDHPVYSNPTWGAQPARTYTAQTVSQPVYSQSTYSQPTYQQASYSQPQYSTSTTRYVSSAPTTTYVRPATRSYASPHRVKRRRHVGHRPHFHGRYSCDDRH